MSDYTVAIVGGGILGTSIAYFLSGHARDPNSIVLIEQEQNIGRHTSSRNTGKAHAPFLYDPVAKKTFAKAASLGYELWLEYSQRKNLLFKSDGVMEVALDDRGISRLHQYMKWGEANGLKQNELKFLDKEQARVMEPNVRCVSALYCSKDASVDYGAFALALLDDLRRSGGKLALGQKVERIKRKDGRYFLSVSGGKQITSSYVVNAAGGNSMDVAHLMGAAKEYTDLHFRGEYWQAPDEYRDLTKLSIYSVPRHPDYPFLDPHWIVRADERREVGPNAVPVFGPYAYTWRKNLMDMFPKLVEVSRTGARRTVLDRQFLSLAGSELKSSFSKRAMIARVREFLPALRSSAFTQRGTSGVRSSVIDRMGKFVPDTILLWEDSSVHVLNYNSPGATGALPMAAKIATKMLSQGTIAVSDKPKTLWPATAIADRMRE